MSMRALQQCRMEHHPASQPAKLAVCVRNSEARLGCLSSQSTVHVVLENSLKDLFWSTVAPVRVSIAVNG